MTTTKTLALVAEVERLTKELAAAKAIFSYERGCHSCAHAVKPEHLPPCAGCIKDVTIYQNFAAMRRTDAGTKTGVTS